MVNPQLYSKSELQQFRRYWDESETLRRFMRALLQDWGECQRGGMPNLGYPTVNVLGRKEVITQTEWADWVLSINDDMTLMVLESKFTGKWTKLTIRRMVKVIQYRWAHRGTIKQNAKKMGISTRHYHRLLDDATFKVWVLFQMKPEHSNSLNSAVQLVDQKSE